MGEARGAEAGAPDSLSEARVRIKALVSIAASYDSPLSMEQLSLLLPEGPLPSIESLENFLSRDEVLQRDLTILGGVVAPRGKEGLILKSTEQKALANTRLALARDFTSQLTKVCPWVRLAGVTGSVAYEGSKPEDDIDIFLVVERRRLWVTLLAALLMARMDRHRQGTPPIFCFNRIDDVDHCLEIFRTLQDALFAREALNLKVLVGEDYYHELLGQAPWMGDIFPRLYGARLDDGHPPRTFTATPGGPHWTLLDLLAFLGLGPFLWLQGLLRNRRLGSKGRPDLQFRTVVRRGYCAYESGKFDDLREAYRRGF